jgi:HD-GYP domain-containing protein (c-di-GMP phosphodiesterase class II)
MDRIHALPAGDVTINPVRLIRPSGVLPGRLVPLLQRAGLIDSPTSAGPPLPPSGAAVYFAAPEWADALEAGLAPGSAAVVLSWGTPPNCLVPVFSLPTSADDEVLLALLKAAAVTATGRADALALSARAVAAEERIAALNAIGIALSAERDLDRLLDLILTESRRFTGSLAGSLYLLEDSETGPQLRFTQAHNDAVEFAFTALTMPVTDASLAGYVTRHSTPVVLEDAYEIPDSRPYRFNASFDEMTGFRTRAMVIVPMLDHQGATVGVLQLMNPVDEHGSPTAYPEDLVPLLSSLATQAAVAIRANQLTADMRRLFEDFASAAVAAVEMRDPSTAGHSHRVADYSVELAKVVDSMRDGPYRQAEFSRDQLKELQTAALLHDFGKIGVPERVLVKAKKLEDYELQRIRERFDYALESRESADYLAFLNELASAGRAPSAEDLLMLERARALRAAELEALFDEVLRANEPTVLSEESGSALTSLLNSEYKTRRGESSPLLHGYEFGLLSIPRGSLSNEERLQIEQHVTHTFTFLSTIPWTPELAAIPQIAAAHHEKLNGSGYPLGLAAADIPVQSKILAVCDIFDALTASDRPYKKAVPLEKSLSILTEEASRGVIDADIVEAFIGARAWMVREGD